MVELAIVLVIIGLIVGGVLAGADLIKSANLQKAVRQVNDTETGVAAFRLKYNQLPGDMKNASAAFLSMTSAGNADGQGDGDGIVESIAEPSTPVLCDSPSSTTLCVSGEVAVFYYQLAQAGYIKENIGFTDPTRVDATAAEIATMFLPSALGKSGVFIAGRAANNGSLYVSLLGLPSGVDAAGGDVDFVHALNAQEASSIDSKLDDGLPDRGNVVSIAVADPLPGVHDGFFTYFGPPPAPPQCLSEDGVYGIGITDTACAISIKLSI